MWCNWCTRCHFKRDNFRPCLNLSTIFFLFANSLSIMFLLKLFWDRLFLCQIGTVEGSFDKIYGHCSVHNIIESQSFPLHPKRATFLYSRNFFHHCWQKFNYKQYKHLPYNYRPMSIAGFPLKILEHTYSSPILRIFSNQTHIFTSASMAFESHFHVKCSYSYSPARSILDN